MKKAMEANGFEGEPDGLNEEQKFNCILTYVVNEVYSTLKQDCAGNLEKGKVLDSMRLPMAAGRLMLKVYGVECASEKLAAECMGINAVDNNVVWRVAKLWVRQERFENIELVEAIYGMSKVELLMLLEDRMMQAEVKEHVG